jgi:small subunit ribosomal protein S4
MKLGPKYKLARRLGAPIFEKTQTAKFAASKERRKAAFGKPKSAFGLQLNEKQKARFTYGVSEKQFKNYVSVILESKGGSQTDKLFEVLERRLDNTVYRLGFAATRRQARQMVSHGHVKVNGRKLTIPSYSVKNGDKVTIRKESEESGLFKTLDERLKDITIPEWITFDIKTKEGAISGIPKAKPAELMFDLEAVFEYYRR